MSKGLEAFENPLDQNKSISNDSKILQSLFTCEPTERIDYDNLKSNSAF